MWCTHKFNRHGIRHETGLSFCTSHIAWECRGIRTGEFPDIMLALSCVTNLLVDGEFVLADNGYNDPCVFVNDVKNNPAPRNVMIRQYLARHESVNKRIRDFNILRNKFTGNLKFHPRIFHACVNLVQIQIEHGMPLAESAAA